MDGIVVWPEWPTEFRTWTPPVDSQVRTVKVPAMLGMVVEWYEPEDDDWNTARCLYAYLHPTTREILYLGKADRSSPRERWNGHKADGVFQFIEDEFGLDEPDTIFGEVTSMEGMERLTVELLLDAEELLLWHIEPPANANIPEPKRPGLRITCEGEWPMKESVFEDRGVGF